MTIYCWYNTNTADIPLHKQALYQDIIIEYYKKYILYYVLQDNYIFTYIYIVLGVNQIENQYIWLRGEGSVTLHYYPYIVEDAVLHTQSKLWPELGVSELKTSRHETY